jgi:hypothetical protein
MSTEQKYITIPAKGTPEHDALIVTVATKFDAVLQRWLTPYEYGAMLELNAVREEENTCASGDFCDSNMAMDEALTACGVQVFDSKMDFIPDAIELFDAAWNYAKEHFLTDKPRRAKFLNSGKKEQANA